MWGSPESMELQVLMLLEMRASLPHSGEYDSGLRESYGRFVAKSFPNSPPRLLSHLLGDGERSDELPMMLEGFSKEFIKSHDSYDPRLEADLSLEIKIKPTHRVPPFMSICKYYENFHDAVRGMTRKIAKNRGWSSDTSTDATNYGIPDMTIVQPTRDEGPAVIMQLSQPLPRTGQTSLFSSTLSEAVHTAIADTGRLLQWSSAGADKRALSANIADDEYRRDLAYYAQRLLPDEASGIASVRVGGRVLGADVVDLAASSASDLVKVMTQDLPPTLFEMRGLVRAADKDQGFFRLRPESGKSVKCWLTHHPEFMDRVVEALALDGDINVVGKGYKMKRRPQFVEVESVN
jgi:hypothetical protein